MQTDIRAASERQYQERLGDGGNVIDTEADKRSSAPENIRSLFEVFKEVKTIYESSALERANRCPAGASVEESVARVIAAAKIAGLPLARRFGEIEKYSTGESVFVSIGFPHLLQNLAFSGTKLLQFLQFILFD